MHAIIETPDYLDDADDAGLTAGERSKIIAVLAADPLAGVIIPGTGGARKIRFVGRGKGKSGGYRIITFYSGEDVPCFCSTCSLKETRSICRRLSQSTPYGTCGFSR
jgi:hypothetical protein